jgi:pSer/pThr/pTyr-binding forkhead associated (FHA) protein
MSDAVKVVIFGQAPDCDVRVNDPYVSSRHARAVQDTNGQVWVEDLGSTNGTLIERPGTAKERVYQPVRFGPGDVLWLGMGTAIPWGAPPVSGDHVRSAEFATDLARERRRLLGEP